MRCPLTEADISLTFGLAGGCSEDCEGVENIANAAPDHAQAHIVLSPLAMIRRPKLHPFSKWSLYSRQRGKPRRTEALVSAWGPLGGTFRAANLALSASFPWFERYGEPTGMSLRSIRLTHLRRGMGMEVCTTLGMLSPEQAQRLKEAGLTAYNHNLDTSREFYPSVRTTSSEEAARRLTNI